MIRDGVANEFHAVLHVFEDLSDGDLRCQSVVCRSEGVPMFIDAVEQMRSYIGAGALEEAAAVKPEKDWRILF